MSALPRLDLPPGAHRDLVDALHELHHRAGWPSLRRLASAAGCSHTTVSKTLSGPTLPAWGILELLVEAMDGDIARFRELWLAASAPAPCDAGPTPVRIAGRRAELAAVRRHLETGSGLLLVAGEAGIGKTTLVDTAARTADTFVAVGHCRPLSTQVPLLPVGDLLRDVREAEAEWFTGALKACPEYVASALFPLLPELGGPAAARAEPEFARQQLFAAITTVLRALAAARPLALLVEDLPWADTVTLDLLEVLLSRDARTPVVATWRTGDPDTSPAHTAWCNRVSRRVTSLHLEPLTLSETAEQLAMLDDNLSSSEVARIYDRSRGQPLFTEQLAAARDGRSLPAMLRDALTTRFAALDAESWVLARALAVADRPLTHSQLARAAGTWADLTPALRTLARHRLLADEQEVVRLRHPLVAEAIRHHLVPGEDTEVHRALAELLAELPDAPASEIADHWHAAAEPGQELTWRIRAALAADLRYARNEAFPQWARVVELWDEPGIPVEGRPVTLTKAHTRTIETAIGSRADVATVRRLVDAAMAADLPEQGRAEILLRAGDLECAYGDSDLGLRLIDEAVEINERHAPTADGGHVLAIRALIHGSLGHHEEVLADVERALAVAEAVGDADLRRQMLAIAAWTRSAQGESAEAIRLAAEARSAISAADDPPGAIFVAALETEVLVVSGAPVEQVAIAAAEALVEAGRWRIHNAFTDSVVANLATAHLRAGDVPAAAALVDPRVAGLALTEQRSTQAVHGAVEVCRGHLEAAIARLSELGTVGTYAAGSAERDLVLAQALLWARRPDQALDVLRRAGDFLLCSDFAGESSGLLALHARAEADCAIRAGTDKARDVARRRTLGFRAAGTIDPLGPEALGVDLRANTLLWQAEVARPGGTDRVDLWVRAAGEWDDLHRPHDAAYCRWRAGQAAQRDGQRRAAARLIRRAAHDARGHAPLAAAVAATASGCHSAPSQAD